MRSFPLAELEVVGFNGVPTKACGQAIPVARHRGSMLFFNVTINDEVVRPKFCFTEREFRASHQEGRVTLLPEPVPAVLGATVLYVTGMFLRALEYDAPGDVAGAFTWHELREPGLRERTWAAYESKKAIDGVLNACSERLVNKSSALLKSFLLGDDQSQRAEAEHVADMALFAARDPALRSRAYLPYGLAVKLSQTSERLDALYEYFVRRDFPDWPWESFLTRLNRFKDTLSETVVTPRSGNPANKPRLPEEAEKPENAPDEIRKEIGAITSIEDDKERLRMSREAAQQRLRLCQPDPREVADLLKEAEGGWLPLDNTQALLLAACEESSYFHPGVVLFAEEGGHRPKLNLTRLVQVVSDPESELEAGPIADVIGGES